MSSSPPLPLPRMQLGLLGPDFVLALFLARLRALRRRSARPAMMAWFDIQLGREVSLTVPELTYLPRICKGERCEGAMNVIQVSLKVFVMGKSYAELLNKIG